MIRINQIKINIDSDESELERQVLKVLKIRKEQLLSYRIVKKSIDARKEEIMYVFCVDVKTTDDKNNIKRSGNKNVMLIEQKEYKMNCTGDKQLNQRPVIVGFGPAGIFCAYTLALKGFQPLVIERGLNVEERIKKVGDFWKTNKLDTDCNVQFGEGGAGTFSDGKLNTLVKDNYGRGRFVLETFTKFGAPDEILYLNKPHIGTDRLTDVVKNMRKEIIRLGGEIRFGSKLVDMIIDNGELKGVKITSSNDEEIINTSILVLAIGHSARDTFNMIYSKGLNMSKKAFAIGLRIEHKQEMIGNAMYGKEYKKLPAADYKLTHKASNDRGIYSFCMCPGGFVVNASSEESMIAVNGMSNYKRDESNANSALVVTVTPDDFKDDHPLAGVNFQREWEKKAYEEGNGMIPIQLLGDFKDNNKTTGIGAIKPNLKGNYSYANLNNALPKYVSDSIKEGIIAFDKRIKGFSNPEAILSGVETRTSSPVRIERDEKLKSNIEGIYPCGEGAGYAGGITSAAIDGIKISEAIISEYKPAY